MLLGKTKSVESKLPCALKLSDSQPSIDSINTVETCSVSKKLPSVIHSNELQKKLMAVRNTHKSPEARHRFDIASRQVVSTNGDLTKLSKTTLKLLGKSRILLNVRYFLISNA